MTENKIRKICYENINLLRKFKLTEHRIKIIRFVRMNPNCTTNDIKDAFFSDINTTSMLMKRLSDLDYINRKETNSSSGGIEYTYTVGDWVE